MARGAARTGLLITPLICVAHAWAVTLLYRTVARSTFALLLLPLLATVVMLVIAIVLLWLAAGGDTDGRLLVLVLGFQALLLTYVGAYFGIGNWTLRWQGTGTTCTVLAVEKRWEMPFLMGPQSQPIADLHDGMVLHYDHELTCADDHAPGMMTTESGQEVGEQVAVVYDPSAGWGSWGITPATELEWRTNETGVSAVLVSGGTGVWTLCVLGCAAADVRAHLRSRR
ncbi:hypothetical protein [Streptomyces sp. MAR4 CNX-425]|uniref:hypothetical protein n=1 Tax=Streptomyces sp. MAR4 CNX-425 TaxID=3406343 RepID=UPI003B500F2E